MITIEQNNRLLTVTVGLVAVVILGVITFLMLGLPNIASATAFFSVSPTPQNAGNLIVLVLWVAFALIGIYALSSGAGVLHQTWTNRRREQEMEMIFGTIGLAVLALAFAHGSVVHAGSVHGVLQFVRNR